MLILKKTGKTERKDGFMSGVIILSLSTLIVKIIGLAFKIPMLSLLGMEGMGYFNSAYEIYALLCVISTAGLPVALSILVSSSLARNDFCGAATAYRSAKRIFFVFGALGMVFMLFFAKILAAGIGNEGAFYCITAIAPALLFICLASAVRGYCQGFGNMKPTAVSQLIEALAKLALGVAFAILGIKKGFSIPVISALAVLGITIGTFFSLCYLLFEKRRLKKSGVPLRLGKGDGRAKELVKIALPITLGSAIISLTRIVDMTLMMRRLQEIGVSQFRANEIYGAYTTLALPVFSLIPSLITPISMALIPELTNAIERESIHGQTETVEKALRLTSAFSMPAALALTVFSRQILSLLFQGQSEAVEIGAPLLSLLGGSVLFSCLITTTNAILQSYGCVGKPIFSMSVGVVVKALSSYFLLGTESVGAYGAPIGSLACNVTVVLLNFALMMRCAKNTQDAISLSKSFLKPFIASIFAIGGAYGVFCLFSSVFVSEAVAFVISMAVAVMIYALLAFLLGILTRDDVTALPLLNRLVKQK